MRKFIASSIVSALILTSPGLASYAAAAEVLGRAGTGSNARPLAIVPLNLNSVNPSAPGGANGLNLTPGGVPSIPSGSIPQLPANASRGDAGSPLAGQTTQIPASEVPTGSVAQGPLPLGQLISQKDSLTLPADKVAAMPEGEARSSGFSIIDRILGFKAGRASGEPVQAAGPAMFPTGGLSPSGRQGDSSIRPPSPPSGRAPSAPASSPRGSKLLGLAKTILRVGGAAAGIAALSVLGVTPIAAVWAASPAVLFLLPAAYARYRLSLRDSPRLDKIKWVLDLSIGAMLGAVAIAYPSLTLVLASYKVSALAAPVAVAGMGTLLAAASGGRLADIGLTWGVLAGVPALLGAGALGAIGLGSVLGIAAFPAAITVAFFLGRIVFAAETGAPFTVPGAMQKLRFPSFNWVMLGVVFALLTGYGAVYSNMAFLAWSFWGEKRAGDKDPREVGPIEMFLLSLVASVFGQKAAMAVWNSRVYQLLRRVAIFLANFNVLYAGVVAVSVLTGFQSPLTFLALAFAPERAAHWTERLIGRLLPASAPAPSTKAAPPEDPSALEGRPAKAPRYHHWLKAFSLLGLMGGLGFAMGTWVFGMASLMKSTAVAAVLAAIPFFFSNWIIKKVMKAEPTDERRDPEFVGIMMELRERINAKRAAKGKKPIPVPEMVSVPMDIPNAFATGRSPFHATVGVTAGIKDMLLEPENVREQLVRLMAAADPAGKPFRVFRKAVAGSVPGIKADSSPNEVAQAVSRASREDLKKLGVRMLRGVLGHEFSHVMDRHMLSGSIGGAISSGVAFASYGVLWAIGHAKAAAAKLKARFTSRWNGGAPAGGGAGRTSGDDASSGRPADGRAKPEALDPVSTGLVLKSLPAVLRAFAALWGTLVFHITQMAASRNNEAQADEDGAYLTDDPESLALGLGMLMTWRPSTSFLFSLDRLPMLAAVSHLFTVNPLQQLHAAQVLPKAAPAIEQVVGKGDNFLFDMFMTHPDTVLRIERLHDMSEALHPAGGDPFRPQPPPEGGGGNLSPPLAFAPVPGADTAPTDAGRGGPFRRAWEKLTSFLPVLPDKGRNAEYWTFVLGVALINVGINFHYSALTKTVDPTGTDGKKMGYNRAANSGAQVLSNLFTGPLVDRASVQKILVWTYLIRSLLLVLVVPLYWYGSLSFAAFTLIIFFAGFLQSTSITAGSVAFNRLLAKDAAYYNKANFVFNVLVGLVGTIVPVMAGVFITAMNVHFALPLAGNALAYGVYAVLALLVALSCLALRIPRDELLQARRDLADTLKGRREVKGVLAERIRDPKTGEEIPSLVVEVAGDPAEAKDIPQSFGGFPVRVIARRGQVAELRAGFRLIDRDHFLRWDLVLSTFAVMMADPMIFTALPRYIADVLHGAALPAFLAHIPVLGGLLQGLVGHPEGIFTLYLSASALGTTVASMLLMLMRDRSASGLQGVLARFQGSLASLGTLDDEALASASAAVSEASAAVLARYRAAWETAPDVERPAWQFRRDLLEEASARVNARLFGGAKSASEMGRLFQETGLTDGLSAWAERHFEAVAREARREARGGLDSLQRQGRWSALLGAVGWLFYLGVFCAASLGTSLAAIAIALALQAPALAIWMSLTQRLLERKYPESMGKIYAAFSLFELVYAILGAIVFSSLMASLATATALWVVKGSVALMALCAVVQAFVCIRPKAPAVRGPKP